MGSLVGLSATTFALLLGPEFALSPISCFFAVLVSSLLIGLIHGLLITRLNLQPFIVTLCGLFIYRGIARTISGGSMQGFGDDPHDLVWIAGGKVFGFVPIPFLIMVFIAIVAYIFLNKTTYGTYILALGKNEKAATYSGVNTKKMIIISYMICSVLGGFAGILFAFDNNSVNPADFGNFFELYAIAGAVLGGCSLRGGYGSILGIVLGAALVQLIEKATIFLGVSDDAKFTVVGCIILIGVLADEVLGKYYARKKQQEP
jgi:ribose transport system permease protein